MKKAFLIFCMLCCLSAVVDAQLVNGINFQAVARNAAGTVIANRKITVRMSVREGSPTGFLEYSEIKATVTNAVGLFVLVLGDPGPPSTIITGSYAGINWSTGNKYLQIDIDPTGGIDFISLGSQKINFVPFALYANGVAARNISGVLSIDQGGTGSNNLLDLKVNLQLDKADNTSDMDKPVSNPVQSALDTKESLANKSNNITNDAASDVKYPSVKAVKSYADAIDARIPAPQVNVDWNATSGIVQILNKPSLATVAISGDYNDLRNKPSVFNLPTASATVLGGVKIGNNIFIDANGAISASGSGLGSVTSVTTDRTLTGGPITTFGTLRVDTTLISTKANVTAALLSKLSLTDLPLAVANGGTGASSAAAGLNALLPPQTGNAGRFLQTDGTNVSWVTSTGSIAVPVSGENGGTGVSNAGKTITLGGNLVTQGAFVTTLTVNGTTDLNLPVSGTLATLQGTETFTNKTLTAPVITSPTISGILSLPSGATGVTASAGDNSTKLATTAFVSNAVTSALPDASTSAKGIVQLAGDLSGTAAAPSVRTVGGATAANIATAADLANSATRDNTANTIVRRDASGDFSAGTITATVFSGALSGNASTATAANTAATVTEAAQPLITSVGTLNSLNVTGTVTASTLSATTINGILGTATQSNITSVGTLNSLNVTGTVTASTLSATTINGTLGTATQNNITSVGTLNALNVNGTITASTLSATTINGTLGTATQNTITSVGTLNSLNVNGTVTASTLSATTINGTLGTATQNTITSVGTLNSLNVNGTVTASTLSATTINGTLGTPTQNTITSVGTLNSLNVNGTVTASTLSATTINGTLGTATQNTITGVGTLNSLNVNGTVTASTLSATTINGTLGTATQNNITGVGTLNSLNVNGTVTASTLSATTINGTLGTPTQNSITSVGTLTGLTVSGTATISSFTTTGFVQSTSAGVLQSSALSSSNVITALGFTPVGPYFGSFSDNTTQTPAAINTATVMTLNTTEIGGHGVSLVGTSQLKVDNAGIYNLQFSAQMSRTTAGSQDVTIWFRKNGTDVPNSATDFNLSSNTALEVAAWNYFFDLAAGDYVEIVWSIPVTGISIQKLDVRTLPTRPAVPSLIVTMHRIN